MVRLFRVIFVGLFACLLLAGVVSGQNTSGKKTYLTNEYADHLEVVFDPAQFIYDGNVVFKLGDGFIYCDSAIWIKGKYVNLKGSVIIDDPEYHLAADSVFYDVVENTMTARGNYVELWSRRDSLFAVGTFARYNRTTEYFFMDNRPTMYLKYPDSLNMVEIIADFIEYEKSRNVAEASGNVKITSKDILSQSGCAVMHTDSDVVDLFEDPILTKGESTISGEIISIISENNVVSKIDVFGMARGEFKEPIDSAKTDFDRSILTGKRIIFDFDYGQLARVTCHDQAYSWYFPASVGKTEINENTVSGDTIKFEVKNQRLQKVQVIGGAIGTYVSGKVSTNEEDSVQVPVKDTIDYDACYIEYSLIDSVIRLQSNCHVTSGAVALEAYRVIFDTREDLIEAFSAEVLPDTTSDFYEIAAQVEPNRVPVILKDKEDELYGDYLEYSIDTEKGRIVQTKSNYEQGTYYGTKAYRANKDIFYIKNGRFTPCDINYLHFYSTNMKLIEDNKLIAKPVVMYVHRIPVIALPYYVFPLKKGRHSGFTQFSLGNIERGERYIRNVGYYWAASQYWDLQSAVDYYERERTINSYNRFIYKKRYVFDGYISGNYTVETGYNSSTASESKKKRWTIDAAHNHQISPTFKISASGRYQSDATYYNDYSVNLEDRLNRTTRSKVDFSKRFSRSVALSGYISNDINLDAEIRTTQFPSLNLSLPVIRPFGSGYLDDEGKLEQHWYNNITMTYRPSLINYSRRIPVDSVINEDTLTFRSRKKYTRIDHSANVSMPFKLFQYITFNPNFNYRENWYKIYNTDQSRTAGLEATNYRTYSYNTGVSASTKLYGTIYPKVFGLLGLRQVITPSVSYSFTPKINRHPEVRQYAGGSAGSSARSSRLNFTLNHIYQAKVKKGELERNLDLVSITSSFSYDFENEEFPLSDLSTSFSSTLIPKINFYGSMLHSFYEEGTNDIKLFSPYLQRFDMNLSFSIGGEYFIFNDPDVIMKGADSASQLDPLAPRQAGVRSGTGWNMSVTYNFSESGRDKYYTKSSFIRFMLNFKLTENTSISYSQYYNITGDKTVNNHVSITKIMKCWTGTFYWVPIGSNRGYGFSLFVTVIPAIKIDNSQNTLSSSYFQTFR